MADALAPAPVLTPPLPEAVGAPELWAREALGVGAASLAARKGRADELRARVLDAFGVAPPAGPFCDVAGGVTAIGVSPGAWLVLQNGGGLAFARELATATRGLASVCDQSSGYLVLEIGGPRALEILQKGPFIDLSPAGFPEGAAAVTLAAHMGLILWRPAPDRFGAAVFRSYAHSFRHWLEAAAAMSGARLCRQPSLLANEPGP